MKESKQELQWYALRTRPRSEKWVWKQLEKEGVEAWVPVRWSVRKYPGRVRKSQIPLISGYVFVKTKAEDFTRILKAEGVFHFVRFGREIPVIPSEQIDLLKLITGEDLPAEMTETLFEKGDAVEIIGGELTGVAGELVEFKGKNKVLLRLENIGLSFLFEVPTDRLRKMN